MSDPIRTHHFTFNPEDNGGESFRLITEFTPNGDPGGWFQSHRLRLESYGNAAEFQLCGFDITPEKLRQLANELESIRVELNARLQ